MVQHPSDRTTVPAEPPLAHLLDEGLPDGEFLVSVDQVATPYARALRDEKHEAELDESLRLKGQLVAAVVSARKLFDKWILLEGHTRLLSIAARNEMLRVRVERNVTDEASERAFIHLSGTGKQRSDLDKAANLQAYIDNGNRSQSECARVFGMSTGQVSKLLARYKLPQPIRAMLVSGSLPLAHTEVLRKLGKNETQMIALAEQAVAEKLTEAQLRELIKPKPGRKAIKLTEFKIGEVRLVYPASFTLKQLMASAQKLQDELAKRLKDTKTVDVTATEVFKALEGASCTSNGS